MRLRRSDPAGPGYGRRRRGRGFSYLDPDGTVIRDRDTLARIRGLVIPPAWTDVWISPDPRGHIQATGVDAAGRTQYRYHPDWRTARDGEKFDHVLEVAGRLPAIRDRIRADLTTGRGLTRDRVLAAIVRLLDLNAFRVGGDEYADRDEDPSYGLSTLKPEHLRAHRGTVILDFPGKSGVAHTRTVDDAEVCAVLRDLRRRRRREPRLFAYWDAGRRRWQVIDAGMINDYLREISGRRMTAKDFRTWHGTVKAAAELAAAGPQPTRGRRRKAVAAAMEQVAELLGNTAAVARASYVDPRVVEHYEHGEVAERGDERAVRRLLRDDH
ncbi:DNA topoisomerase IB [Krasilnikovia sp. MM14-A1004]|uniref:DNA topoisomerase IB n=1 Tax=Krasilnikovia sp. MM14-A1004 TaxID=3373541 RepID=UPI00399C5896